MVLDRFSGGNPTEWVFRAEQYFTYLGFSENDWLPLVSFYLDGAALDWFQWLHRNKQFFDWKHFTEKLTLHFRNDSDTVHNHITIALDLLQKLDEKLDNVERELGACSNSVEANPVLPDAEDKRDSDLPLDESAFIVEDPTDTNSDTVDECVHSWSDEQSHMQVLLPDVTSDLNDETLKEVSRIYVCKVFTEIPDREINMKSVDSVKNDFIKSEPQVFDELFHTISIVKCDSSNPVKVEEFFCALPCMLLACSHVRGLFSDLSEPGHAKLPLFVYQLSPDQFGLHFPFDPGSNFFTTFFGSIRDCVCWGALSSCNNSRFMTLNMKNSCITPFKPRLQNINRVCECVLGEVVDDARRHTSYFIVCPLDMLPELAECYGYDLKCLVSQSNLVGKGVIFHVWDRGIHRHAMKLNHWNNDILSNNHTQGGLMNAKEFKRPVCRLIVHQSEPFLVGGEIEKWEERCWNFQKLDHQQLVEILRDEHESVPTNWTAERHAKYIWVEVLDGTRGMHKHIFIHFPFDLGSSLFTTSLRAMQNGVCLGTIVSMNRAKFTTLISENSCVSPWELQFKNTDKMLNDALMAVTIFGRHYARYSVVFSLRLLSRLAEDLDKGIKSLDFQGNISKWLLRCCSDNVYVTQPTVFGLLVFCPRVCAVQLRYLLTEILDAAAEKLSASSQQQILLVALTAWPGGGTTPCELLKKKVNEWVNILMLVWADRIVVHVLKRTVPLTACDEGIAASFQDVDIHYLYVTYLGNQVDGESLIMHSKLFTLFTHYHQKLIMNYDLPKGESQSGIVLFVGGSSLYAWQCTGASQISPEVLILQVVSKMGTMENFNVYALALICPKGIFDSNLEDKVLIEGGSIVVNGVGFVRAYGLELVNKTDAVKIVGPSKMLESFIWDPDPLSNGLKRTKS